MSSWTHLDDAELDRGYDAAATVPSVQPYVDRYVARSAETRARFSPQTDVSYGPDVCEKLDLFPAAVAGAPLVLFVHGGYWRRFSKNEFSFVVEPYVARGCAAAVVSYPLAPAATLDEIVTSVRRAVAWLHRNVHTTRAAAGRIVAMGHSAGGHLVAMLAATDWTTYGFAATPSPTDSPLRAIVPISGLFELEPLRRTKVNEWMKLDEAAAERNSPILRVVPSLSLVAAVGGDETSEFRRQTAAYYDRFDVAGGRGKKIVCEGRNHFDVLDDAASESGPIARAVFAIL